VRADELLGIDVSSELANVMDEQLHGPWQVPAELVRAGVLAGAASIDVSLGRRAFDVRWIGATVPEEELRHLTTVLDPAADPGRRHRALERLERASLQALLWTAGVADGSLLVKSEGGGLPLVLERRGGGRPSLRPAAGSAADPGLVVRATGSIFDRSRADSWLRAACRFAPIEVRIEGEAVARGFRGALRVVPAAEPVPLQLAVVRSGDAPRLWLLRHGVVSTRATVPSWPSFEAAVELGDRTRFGATPEELRAAVTPFLQAMLETSVGVVADLARRLEDLQTTDRERVLSLLLRLVRHGVRRAELFDLPVIEVLGGAGGQPRRISLRDLERLAAEQDGSLVSVSPAGSPGPAGRSSEPAVVVTDEQRGLLGDLLRIPLQRARPRAGERGLREALSILAARVGGLLRGRWSLLGRRRLPEDELLEAERRLVRKLEGNLEGVSAVEICAGAGPIRSRRGRLSLSRHHPLVVRAVALVAEDERWLYPAALALAAWPAKPSQALRRRWLDVWLSGDGSRPLAGRVGAG
jgi:hypothetical protein